MALEQLSQLRELQLELLKSFVEFCKANSLTYFVIGGTLLGTVRHSGFIPWDDDIDVGMPRKDYNKFLAIWHGGFPANNQVQDFYNGGYISYYAKLANKNYLVTTNESSTRQEVPLWIDIFPLDNFPNGKLRGRLYTWQILAAGAIFSLSSHSTKININKKRPLYEKVAIWIAKTLRFEKFLDSQKLMASIIKLQQKYSKHDTNSLYIIASWHRLLVFKKVGLGKGQKYLFEGVEVNVPVDADYCLKLQYGDYMKLPPESERIGHSLTEIRQIKTGQEV